MTSDVGSAGIATAGFPDYDWRKVDRGHDSRSVSGIITSHSGFKVIDYVSQFKQEVQLSKYNYVEYKFCVLRFILQMYV